MVDSETIYCFECEERRRKIESSGLWKFIDCTPLPGQENKPERERLCTIRWELMEDTNTPGP